MGRALLGPETNVGSEMAQWLVVRSGDVVPFASLRLLTDAEMRFPVKQRKRIEFDAAVRARHGDSINTVDEDGNVHDQDIGEIMELYEDDDEARVYDVEFNDGSIKQYTMLMDTTQCCWMKSLIIARMDMP